jgi:hypothetical protein
VAKRDASVDNHDALLKTLEDIFQLGGYLGYANQPGLVPSARTSSTAEHGAQLRPQTQN